MEVWQVAAMFGLPDDDEVPEDRGGTALSSEAMRPSRDQVRDRYMALTGRGPTQVVAPTGTDLIRFVEGVGGG